MILNGAPAVPFGRHGYGLCCVSLFFVFSKPTNANDLGRLVAITYQHVVASHIQDSFRLRVRERRIAGGIDSIRPLPPLHD
jgi:hypothetical protein